MPMKHNNLIPFLLAGVMFLLPATQTGCDQRSSDLSFTRGELRYVVDPVTGKVSIFSKDGKLLEIYHTPAAGFEQAGTPLPPAIIHYLLLGNGSVSGIVWNDHNGNRTLDPGENTAQNIRVYLDADSSGTYTPGDPFELTDANGFYTFPKVKPGITNIFIDTDTLPGGYGVTTDNPVTVSLARKQAVTDVDFGIGSLRLPAELDGTIWDRTANQPIPGVRVYVDLNNDDEFTTGEPAASTDASGNYLISEVPPGTFKVHADNGTLDVKYHRTPVQGTNPTLVSFASQSMQTVNLTYIHKATICGSLQDSDGRMWSNVAIYIDLNNNGAYDEGEPKTVTDGSGRYCFDELMPGEYTLRLRANPQWDAYFITSPGLLTVGEGDAASGADFLLQAKPSAISGQVWSDENGSGGLETEEKGLAGITVFLDTNNNGVLDPAEASVVTDETGSFSFTNLKQGNYYIRVEDSGLQDAYNPSTPLNPIFRPMGPGQTFDGAKFGYQRKLALLNTLNNPTRLSWGGDGNLYVSDNLTGSVFIFDAALRVSGELKGLARPLGVAADSDGNIYVGNQGRKNVEVYSPGGTLLRTIGEGEIITPNDIAVDRDNTVYILDSTNDTIQVYDQEGLYLSTIGDAQQFKFPVSVAVRYRVDAAGAEIGELYVADQPACTIKVFGLDGAYQRSLGSCGTMYTSVWDGMFSGLVAVDIDQSGNIHGLDNNLNVVQVFEPVNGAFVRSYNAYPPENEYRINLQTDLSINPADQRVVISNFETKSVETITTTP